MKTVKIYGVQVRSKKESFVMHLLALILFPFNPKFLYSYWTTWYGKVYAPVGFSLNDQAGYPAKKRVLEHEGIHLKDMKKWKFLFRISYLLLPLPFGLAYCRWRWERKAYLPELKELKNHHTFAKRLNQIVNALGGPDYMWTYPKSWMRKWFMKKVYPDGNHPHEFNKDGSLIEHGTTKDTGKIRLGRGYNTSGQIGMRQLL